MGGGLLPMAVHQSLDPSAEPPLSGASPLPQLISIGFKNTSNS
ncbi:hypothetical protein C4J92_4985 [Pseudomonas sp. R3-18-08]|nr:hypothetical protein C4J92_4985 [Pseudomonas sp. R3-18-08]AZF23844.1 hypothetical protein C4J91_5142 [Pseudomonas sp. R3-52-08]